MATTEVWLLKEYQKRANEAGLVVDCLGHGDPNSEIVVIAEAPGEREKQMGIPLVGGTGQKLWKELRALGIERTQCYVTNVCKRQVSQSTKADIRSPVKSHEGEHWISLLRWELDQLTNKKIILVLGGLALKALFGHDHVTAWRGSVLHYKGVPAVITFNPAMVLREPKWDPIFKFDVHKLTRVMAGRFNFDAKKSFIYYHSLSPREVLDHLTCLRDEKRPISFDIETIANETACVGFSNGMKRGVCVNFRDVKTNIYSNEDERKIRLAIQDLFFDGNLKFVAQNGNFDSYWLWYKDRIRVPKVWFDTMTAHHTLYPRLPHNLGFLTTQYTDYPYYKDDKTIWREGGDISTFWNYNCDDAIITWEVHERILRELVDQKMDKFYFDHVQKIAPELVLMTVGGIKIDVSLKEQLKKELREDVEKYEARFVAYVREATGNPEYEINFASPVQLSRLFFTDLKLVGRGYSTDQDNRDRMKSHHGTSEIARKMLTELDTLKQLDKFKNTYAEMEIDEDERVRCEYRQIGTQKAPGRLSSAKVMWGSGMNLQNQPEKAYKMFIADEGHVFVYNDLSQAEARIVAELWQVARLKENFAKASTGQFDVHRLNASSIFQLPYESIPEYDRLKLGVTTNDPLRDGEPTQRFIGKRCVHGLNYRMGPDHLAEVCQIPLQQAIAAYQRYHAAFPEIKKGWDETIKRVKKDKVIYTPLGRRLLFLEPIVEDDQLDSIIAFVPQSTIGDKVAATIQKCHNDKEWPRTQSGRLVARMMLNIHDALISMTPPSEIETVIAITRKYSEEPVNINGVDISIPSEFKVSQPDQKGVHRWSTLEKWKSSLRV